MSPLSCFFIEQGVELEMPCQHSLAANRLASGVASGKSEIRLLTSSYNTLTLSGVKVEKSKTKEPGTERTRAWLGLGIN